MVSEVGEGSFSTVKGGTSSVAILFSKEESFQVTNTLEDPDRRFLPLNGTTQDFKEEMVKRLMIWKTDQSETI